MEGQPILFGMTEEEYMELGENMGKTLNLTDVEVKALIAILRMQEEVTCKYNGNYRIARSIAIIPMQSMLNKLGEETTKTINE